MDYSIVHVKHWLPIITFCPVNHLPDLIYVTVEFEESSEESTIHELYAIRKQIRKIAQFKKKFMEDIAQEIYETIPCSSVTVNLIFGRHSVIYYKV